MWRPDDDRWWGLGAIAGAFLAMLASAAWLSSLGLGEAAVTGGALAAAIAAAGGAVTVHRYVAAIARAKAEVARFGVPLAPRGLRRHPERVDALRGQIRRVHLTQGPLNVAPEEGVVQVDLWTCAVEDSDGRRWRVAAGRDKRAIRDTAEWLAGALEVLWLEPGWKHPIVNRPRR